MKAGTVVKLPDGREGTVVYNGLDGVGIKWGRHEVTAEEIGGCANFNTGEPPEDFQLFPDAMLREPYPRAGMECVGSDYEVIA
jgi:hypothetical protein